MYYPLQTLGVFPKQPETFLIVSVTFFFKAFSSSQGLHSRNAWIAIVEPPHVLKSFAEIFAPEISFKYKLTSSEPIGWAMFSSS